MTEADQTHSMRLTFRSQEQLSRLTDSQLLRIVEACGERMRRYQSSRSRGYVHARAVRASVWVETDRRGLPREMRRDG